MSIDLISSKIVPRLATGGAEPLLRSANTVRVGCKVNIKTNEGFLPVFKFSFKRNLNFCQKSSVKATKADQSLLLTQIRAGLGYFSCTLKYLKHINLVANTCLHFSFICIMYLESIFFWPNTNFFLFLHSWIFCLLSQTYETFCQILAFLLYLYNVFRKQIFFDQIQISFYFYIL